MALLGEMGWGQALLGMLIVGVCLFLMLVILLQRGRGTGLAGAFGGGGSSAFGAKTGDVFTWITVVVASVFILLAIVGNFVFEPNQFVQADPLSATAPGEPQTITLPLEEGVDLQAVEMMTEDGQVIPLDVKTSVETVPSGEVAPSGESAPPGQTDQPQGETPPPAGSEGGDAQPQDAPPPPAAEPAPQPQSDEPKEPGR